MQTKLTRDDCKRDNVKVICPNSSLLGFSSNVCKRGYWLRYETDGYSHIGRAKRVFNFFADDHGWQPESIFRALEYGVSDLQDQINAREDWPV